MLNQVAQSLNQVTTVYGPVLTTCQAVKNDLVKEHK